MKNSAKKTAATSAQVIDNATGTVTDVEVTVTPGPVAPTTGAPIVSKIDVSTLKTAAEVLAAMPKLQVIEDMTVSGSVRQPDGSIIQVAHLLDNGYKMAGHMAPDEKTGEVKFHSVPWMKSEGYGTLAHDYILEQICNNLVARGLGFGVWKTKFSRNYGVLSTDILLDKSYKVNETAFESALAVNYNNGLMNAGGYYQPMVRVKSSFFGAASLEFALVRIICTNGMMRIADKLSLKFVHLKKDILADFSRRSDLFLEHVFAQNIIETMMLEMKQEPLHLENFIGWMVKTAGPQTVNNVLTQFNLESGDEETGHYLDRAEGKTLDMWEGYNMMTWAASHDVTSDHKQDRMYARFPQFRAEQALLV